MAYESQDPRSDEPSEVLSDRNRAGLRYVEQKVEEHREDLRTIYGTGDLSAETERLVHIERFGAALSMLDVEATMPGLLKHVRGQEDPARHEPLVRLGYATMDSDQTTVSDGLVSYRVALTQEGLDTINGLRIVMGDPTVEEALAANKEAMLRQAAAIVSHRTSA